MLEKRICPKCGKEFEIDTSKSNRKFCSRSCANGHKHSKETKEKISNSINKKIQNGDKVGFINNPKFNIGKLHICKFCNKEYYPVKTKFGHRTYCSLECKEKYFNEIYLSKLGGYRKGSGRGKSGWYKGIYCDSSWELAFVIYHLDNKLNIQRCKEQRKQIFENKEHIYIPDFITDEGIIEIKGFSTPQWKAKEEQNKDIKVLYKSDIQFYINYVIKKYGNDFIKLYDNSKPIKMDYSNNLNMQIHKYDEINKIYYTMVINPKDLDKFLNDNWLIGRGTKYKDFTKEHIKTQNIFNR